jgi:pectate lyase
VNKADAGTYTLTLYYSNGLNSDTDEYISVNGGSPIIFTGSPTGGFDKFATAGIAVTLHEGKNTIEFYNPKDTAPDIDKIII